jgi:hypothetical protein
MGIKDFFTLSEYESTVLGSNFARSVIVGCVVFYCAYLKTQESADDSTFSTVTLIGISLPLIELLGLICSFVASSVPGYYGKLRVSKKENTAEEVENRQNLIKILSYIHYPMFQRYDMHGSKSEWKIALSTLVLVLNAIFCAIIVFRILFDAKRKEDNSTWTNLKSLIVPLLIGYPLITLLATWGLSALE